MSERDDKIDFGVLDPARDRDRYEAMVNAVVARAQRGISIAAQLRAWARPVLAMAAVLALVVWIAELWRGDSVTAQTRATTLAEWAVNDEIPEATTILEVLGDDDVAQ